MYLRFITELIEKSTDQFGRVPKARASDIALIAYLQGTIVANERPADEEGLELKKHALEKLKSKYESI